MIRPYVRCGRPIQVAFVGSVLWNICLWFIFKKRVLWKHIKRSSTSPSGGNQVDGLPPAFSLDKVYQNTLWPQNINWEMELGYFSSIRETIAILQGECLVCRKNHFSILKLKPNSIFLAYIAYFAIFLYVLTLSSLDSSFAFQILSIKS